jgi:hypothetical protein
MTIQHKLIADPDIHEPKGVAAATSNKVYVSSGSGSGTWQKLAPTQLAGLSTSGAAGQIIGVDGAGNFAFNGAPHGSIIFYNIASPYTLTYPSVFTKIAATTTAGGIPSDFTEATTSRLTYTGTDTVPISITYSISFDQSSGANRDIEFVLYKNGAVSNGYSVSTTSTGNKHISSGTHVINMATGDYVELWSKNGGGSGDIRVYAMQINAIFAGA